LTRHAASPAAVEPAPQEVERVAATLSTVADDELRMALARLGAAIKPR